MTDLRTIESVIITNTIISALCIVLLIILTIFIIIFLIPSIRRRYLQTTNQNQEKNQLEDISMFNRQLSFNSSRFNPIFEPITETTTTTTQFGTLFHPQATTATLLHPTIWTSMTPTSVISSPLSLQPPTTTTTAPTTTKTKTPSISSLPYDLPLQQSTTSASTTAQKPPRRILKKETA